MYRSVRQKLLLRLIDNESYTSGQWIEAVVTRSLVQLLEMNRRK